MAYPVYSERFVVAFTPDVYTNYQVPGGRRAIVTSVVTACTAAGGGRVQLGMGGATIWIQSLPGINTGLSTPMYAVAYQGELIQLFITTSMRAMACGYLLHELGSASQQRSDAEFEPFSPPGPVPIGHYDYTQHELDP